jgi:D-amino-acid dehydrogenase
MPVLGPVPGHPGVWLATGHGAAGLTLGPFSAKLVVEAALEGKWRGELEPFSIARFALS